MRFIDLIQKRCSIRKYAAQAVEQEKIEYILETARLAPSACNFQPWYFVVIQSQEGREKLQACYDREWFRSAPVYILVCSDHNHSWKRARDGKDHADIDVAIATEHICLAAAEQGLGTCWICNFDTVQCARSFSLPPGIDPVVILSVGYPAELDLFERTPKIRKPMSEVVIREKFAN